MRDNGLAGPHPDIRDQICDMANMLAGEHTEQIVWPARPFVSEDLAILGQRTWNDITTINRVIDRGGVSALLVSAEIEGKQYGGLIMAGRKPDDENWGLMGASFGEAGSEYGVRGNMVGPDYQCIAFSNSTARSPSDVHAIEIEYADGTLYRAAQEADGCTILFAPVERWEQKDNQVETRYLAPDGTIIHTETRWLGAGMGPPENHNEEQP